MYLLLWILAVVLVVCGIVQIIRGAILWGVVLIVVGLLVGPGGVSIFDDDDGHAHAAGAEPDRIRPEVACTVNPVWVNYADPLVFPCNPDGLQTVHIRYIPSSWSLATAHTYCANAGSVGAFTRYGNTANVCPDIDY